MTTLTVSMPTFNTPPPLLERAVDSVLSQTFTDLQLIVVNDAGSPVNLPFDDPRLVVYDMQENLGRYFIDAMVLEACDTVFFTAHDSDDWSEPERYAEMVELAETTKADVVAGTTRWHLWDGRKMMHFPKPGPVSRLTHMWHTSALYRADRLLLYPQYPVAMDVFHSSVMSLVGSVTIHHKPRYHWVQRKNSLSTSSHTGMETAVRDKIVEEISDFYEKIFQNTRGKLNQWEIAKAMIEKNLSQDIKQKCNEYARDLEKSLEMKLVR